jgi:hypothetical protein
MAVFAPQIMLCCDRIISGYHHPSSFSIYLLCFHLLVLFPFNCILLPFPNFLTFSLSVFCLSDLLLFMFSCLSWLWAGICGYLTRHLAATCSRRCLPWFVCPPHPPLMHICLQPAFQYPSYGPLEVNRPQEATYVRRCHLCNTAHSATVKYGNLYFITVI